MCKFVPKYIAKTTRTQKIINKQTNTKCKVERIYLPGRETHWWKSSLSNSRVGKSLGFLNTRKWEGDSRHFANQRLKSSTLIRTVLDKTNYLFCSLVRNEFPVRSNKGLAKGSLRVQVLHHSIPFCYLLGRCCEWKIFLLQLEAKNLLGSSWRNPGRRWQGSIQHVPWRWGQAGSSILDISGDK